MNEDGARGEAEEVLLQGQIVRRAREIKAAHGDYFEAMPLGLVVLEVRGFVKFCEMHDIVDADFHARILKAVFRPHPSALSERQRNYVQYLLGNRNSHPESRVRSLETYLAEG